MSYTVPADELHRVVATCVIHRDRRYLIALRAPNRRLFPNKWEITGGGLKRGDYEGMPHNGPDGTWENPLAAHLVREIKEEVGVTVDQLEYVGNFSFIQDGDVPALGLRFMARYVSGPVRINPDEVVDHRWIRAHEVSVYDLLGNVADVIKRVDTILMYRDLRGAAR